MTFRGFVVSFVTGVMAAAFSFTAFAGAGIGKVRMNVPASCAASKGEAVCFARNEAAADMKCVSPDFLSGCRVMESADGYTVLFDREEYKAFCEEEERCMSWLHGMLPHIIPQGTSASLVPELAACWVANHMVYDPEICMDRETFRNAQSAWTGFCEGKGICATYAYMFCAITGYAPIDPVTGTVDYSVSAPVFLETCVVNGYSGERRHAWSAVRADGAWHQYDVCYFDEETLSPEERAEYLDMSERTLKDGRHENSVMLKNRSSEV